MTLLADHVYIGDGERHYTAPDDKDILKQPEPYIPAEKLVEAVNVALYLRRPLLLEGEPGCGKTRLAHATAYELGYPLKECYIRSTSRAQDLLYTYDAVRRLYDIQEKIGKPLRDYVTLGKLGEAIKLSQEKIPSVVLIDEVDKADIDFPNDLLQVLDRMQFDVTEVGDWKFDALVGEDRDKRREFLPLFIITSNREKELPKPFLRRCIYYYIDFPDEESLKKIVKKQLNKEITPLFDNALQKFWQLRELKVFPWRKIPSTSELLDWVRVLERDEQTGEIGSQDLGEKALWNLPHLETLVKTQSDRDALERLRG
jgi:MoxR-like ATPase